MVRHDFEFANAAAAKSFAQRIALHLPDVAVYRDALSVRVFDGREPPQTEEILRLAKASSATWAKSHS